MNLIQVFKDISLLRLSQKFQVARLAVDCDSSDSKSHTKGNSGSSYSIEINDSMNLCYNGNKSNRNMKVKKI